MMLAQVDLSVGAAKLDKFSESTLYVVAKLRAGEWRSKPADGPGLTSTFTH